MSRFLLAALALLCAAPSQAREPRGLDAALKSLAAQGRFSGAVVVRGNDGVRFARGYGLADPFTGRRFTPDTPVDSGSLAKPVTAAGILLLARDGAIDLDSPVVRYLPEFPHASTSVRQLLAHSGGLTFDNTPRGVAGKTNAALLAELARAARPPLFRPGSAFDYCNLCYSALALLIERTQRRSYVDFLRARAALPAGARLRPARLADWPGRAIGYQRSKAGIEPFDSWEGEAFYGSANFSMSAAQWAEWGSAWWAPPLAAIRPAATAPAIIAGRTSGLSLGNFYCSASRRQCHYLGHHEGFHHMLYWDSQRRLTIAMVSNNSIPANFHQPLQRALVAFANGREAAARSALARPLASIAPPAGTFRTAAGERLTVTRSGDQMAIRRGGLSYPAYPTDSPVRYVPGLDAYLAGDGSGRLRLLTLYADFLAAPVRRR